MSLPIREFIYAVLAEFNEREDSEEAKLPLAPDTALFGQGGRLDSLGLINLIVLTEQKAEDEFGVSISLADERAMSLEHSPFASVETFSSYVERRLAGANDGPG